MHEDRDSEARRLTPNQVIAHNLRAARELRGMTQEQAAAHLEQFLGERWSVAVFSAAERSVTGKRIRVFDADTIHAFARAFELPIGFFFLPPNGTTSVGLDAANFRPADPTEQIGLATWVSDEIRERVDELTGQLPAAARAKILRLFAREPGGLSVQALLAPVVARIKDEVSTLEALAGGTE